MSSSQEEMLKECRKLTNRPPHPDDFIALAWRVESTAFGEHPEEWGWGYHEHRRPDGVIEFHYAKTCSICGNDADFFTEAKGYRCWNHASA